MTFGARVKRLREERGWSFREMARHCHFATHRVIYEIERGRYPKIDYLGPIAAAFEMAPHELLRPVKLPRKLSRLLRGHAS